MQLLEKLKVGCSNRSANYQYFKFYVSPLLFLELSHAFFTKLKGRGQGIKCACIGSRNHKFTAYGPHDPFFKTH